METFLIVHGGFGGGWEWTEVAVALRARGHAVFTPTLTGMGERFHLGPEVGLSTHVQGVVGVLEFEDLCDVVLCAASYGGMAATAAADRVPDRVSLVVYVDALIPHDGSQDSIFSRQHSVTLSVPERTRVAMAGLGSRRSCCRLWA